PLRRIWPSTRDDAPGVRNRLRMRQLVRLGPTTQIHETSRLQCVRLEADATLPRANPTEAVPDVLARRREPPRPNTQERSQWQSPCSWAVSVATTTSSPPSCPSRS